MTIKVVKDSEHLEYAKPQMMTCNCLGGFAMNPFRSSFFSDLCCWQGSFLWTKYRGLDWDMLSVPVPILLYSWPNAVLEPNEDSFEWVNKTGTESLLPYDHTKLNPRKEQGVNLHDLLRSRGVVSVGSTQHPYCTSSFVAVSVIVLYSSEEVKGWLTDIPQIPFQGLVV